ncbi:MAG: ubiquitin-activating E1 FCCH domain-containing protein [Candidatus Rhabdochlamydia sp.]
MSYQSFLIANYSTGVDRELQPWLLPNDAFVDLLDGYVYRGVTRKRDGYSGFANGTKSTYTESRMVHQISAVAPATGAINGINATYTWTLTTPVARGRVVITGSNPVQVLTDNGIGGFTGNGTGTINYTTGAVSITFTLPPAGASTVLLTYSYHQGLPVMGEMSFYPTNNVRQLIVADTRYVNRYNPVTDRLDDIAAGTYNGTATDFWSWVNYADPSSVPRLVFANGVVGDVIQQYDGTAIAAYTKVWAGGTLNARQIFNVRDRLVLFQTIEAGVLFPRRIRISGTGANSDTFDNTATGAGFIDIPDNTWFFGAAFNRDDVLFFTEAATWMLKYTGNDVTPFILEKIDGSRGSSAAFSVISYLNRTLAASPRGLIISDGYQVDRMDNNIPEFAFNNIQSDQFLRCFSGFLDEDRDVYLIYPSQGTIKPPLLTNGESDRILVINFEEDNYAIYRIPLSSMGNFQNSLTTLWSDLTAANGFPSWDALAETYGNWNAFPFSKGAPIAIGGGHKGEIWRLNDTQSEDNPQKIRAMTVIDSETLRVTTDWNNYEVGDNIVFESVEGMTEINHKQAPIKAIQTTYNIFDVDIQTTGFSAYTSGGIASKTIPMEALSKKLNPFVELDKKLRCGWIYFYVSVAETILLNDDGSPVPAFLDIDVITNDTDVDSVPTFQYRVDCSNLPGEIGSKKWVKIWINQTSKFLQFRMRNNQAGAKIQVHAMMPGFQPIGRLV